MILKCKASGHCVSIGKDLPRKFFADEDRDRENFLKECTDCLTHQMPALPSSMLPTANQLTGFYIRATLAYNGLI